jgi:hypothetical protein
MMLIMSMTNGSSIFGDRVNGGAVKFPWLDYDGRDLLCLGGSGNHSVRTLEGTTPFKTSGFAFLPQPFDPSSIQSESRLC